MRRVVLIILFMVYNQFNVAEDLASTIRLSPDQEQLLYRCNFSELFQAGRFFKINGRNKDARLFFEVAVLQQPNDLKANWELGDMYGLLGDLTKFWIGQQYRWKFNKDLTERLWRGESLHKKRVLLHSLWGFGDTLQYVRFAKILKDQGANIILKVQRPLAVLLQGLPYIDQIITADDSLPEFDYQAPLMQIPPVLHTTLETIPHEIPYVFANDSLVSYWNQQLLHDTNFKIGICWQGEKRPDIQTQNRSIPLVDLAPLADVPGISLYSLQMHDGLDQLNQVSNTLTIHTFGSDFDVANGAFMDTAAVMKNLDLVLTIDTSIAHLAGALGVPVWVMLPYAAENRFFSQRTDSPWYPTMRLFRQPQKGDWQSVVSNVARALKEQVLHSGTIKNIILRNVDLYVTLND